MTPNRSPPLAAPAPEYPLGHSGAELERLGAQAGLLDPFARRLFRDAGLRPGMRVLGLVIFQEYDVEAYRSHPPAPLYDRNFHLIIESLRRVGSETCMGPRLHAAFRAAGLPAPSLRSDTAIGGGADFAGYQVVAQVTASLLPVIERLGLATAAELRVESMAARIRDEVVAGGGVVAVPPLVGAYATRPGDDGQA